MIFGGILTIDKHAVSGVMLSDGIDGGFDWKKVQLTILWMIGILFLLFF